MYCDYFGLSREPFSISPDPAFVYPSAQHRQALAHLKYGLEREGGFLLLTGEVGTGKTTLVRLLVEQVPASFRIAYILNATLDKLDVLASICEELGLALESQPRSAKAYVDLINADLLQAHASGRKTLVIIEEAQNLAPDVLEMLRLLTNLETNTTKLLHILLVGQPELLDTLARPELRQLNQRIISRFHIEPLDRSETERYLNHRLAKAGCGRPLFENAAIKRMHRLADGVPRKLNLIAERALLGAFAENKGSVGPSQVLKAREEVFGQTNRPRRPVGILLGGFVVFLITVASVGYYLSNSPPQAIESVQVVEQVETPSAEPMPIDVDPEPVIELVPTPIEEPTSVYSSLLSRWSIELTASSLAEICSAASQNGLLCAEQTLASLDDAIAVNRPMLIHYQGDSALIESAQNDQVNLRTADGQQILGLADLARDWERDVLYLWRPPLGYNGSVRVGDRNSTVVNWLLGVLQTFDPAQPDLITGGNYSQAVSESVAAFQRSHGLVADGVLGQQTIMAINELQQAVPLLTGSYN